MGFFWNKNKYDICPEPKELKTFITNYLGANSQIKINSKVTVPAGYICVLGKRGKVADKFDEGEHFLNFASMPYMCRRFGVDKVQDGTQKDKISCECYFVSTDLQPGQFKTYRKVEMGTKAYGVYKMHVFGMYSYKVDNPQELMQSLLNEFDYIKTGEAERIIEAWVNDIIVETLEKNNFVITDIVNNNPIITEALKKSINKLFATAGLKLCELKIYKYKLPKQFQAESDAIIAQQNAQNEQPLQNIETKQPDTSDDEPTTAEVQVEKQNIVDENENIEYNQSTSNTGDQYVPFGNFQMSQGNLQDLKEPPKPQFVDLNLDNLYDDKKDNIKRCLNCGAENDISADHCVLCGEKFIEGDY